MKIIFVNIDFVEEFEKEVLTNNEKADASVFDIYAI